MEVEKKEIIDDMVKNVLAEHALFEINDSVLWSTVEERIGVGMEMLVERGVIHDAAVICDDGLNTPGDQTLNYQLAIQYREGEEFIYHPGRFGFRVERNYYD